MERILGPPVTLLLVTVLGNTLFSSPASRPSSGALCLLLEHIPASWRISASALKSSNVSRMSGSSAPFGTLLKGAKGGPQHQFLSFSPSVKTGQ